MLFATLGKWLGVELVEVSIAERCVSAIGGSLAIGFLLVMTQAFVPGQGATAVITSMGASAVLLFGVPHGPLSQPWPVIAGHGISALIGVTCACWIPHPMLAAACAVGLSIGAMLQFKCIHPPGGATAFSAVMGGSAIHALGFWFVVVPVLANALFMVLLAIAINWAFKWRRYPAYLNAALSKSVPLASAESNPSHEEILAAIRALDSFVDISEEDLLHLLELIRHPGNQSLAPKLREFPK
jgi:CBS domain-containing membrane protein